MLLSFYIWTGCVITILFLARRFDFFITQNVFENISRTALLRSTKIKTFSHELQWQQYRGYNYKSLKNLNLNLLFGETHIHVLKPVRTV